MALLKSVLITGCSDHGIGSALAVAFQERGSQVFATARSIAKMSALAGLPNVTMLGLDITNPLQIKAAVETVEAQSGGTLDYLINNAGIYHFLPLVDEDIQDAKNVFDTNVWGTLAVTQAFTPLLIHAKGTIVNISSISSCMYVPWIGTYAASKAALNTMSQTLRLELAPFGVKVQVAVVGGVGDTQVVANAGNFKLPEDSLYKSIEANIKRNSQGIDQMKPGTPKEFADSVIPIIISGNKHIFWTGAFAGFVKFATAWLPFWLTDKVWLIKTGVDTLWQQNKKEQ